MPIYLYCLTGERSPRPAPALRGVGEHGVRAVEAGPLVAWVSDVRERMVEVTPTSARAHDAVVRAAMAAETPLPARFGQTFADDESLRAALAGRATSLGAALERVRGMVEMTVRILSESGDDAESVPVLAPDDRAVSMERSSGRAYLERVRARHARERALAQRAGFLQNCVAHAVRGVAVAEVRGAASVAARTLGMSHLVPRNAVARYRAALRTLREREPRLKLMVSGPWAPYSFSEPTDA